MYAAWEGGHPWSISPNATWEPNFNIILWDKPREMHILSPCQLVKSSTAKTQWQFKFNTKAHKKWASQPLITRPHTALYYVPWKKPRQHLLSSTACLEGKTWRDFIFIQTWCFSVEGSINLDQVISTLPKVIQGAPKDKAPPHFLLAMNQKLSIIGSYGQGNYRTKGARLVQQTSNHKVWKISLVPRI